LWSLARYDLRLPEDEIGQLTMREFDALMKRKRDAMNHARLNVGIVAATILNSAPFADPNRKPCDPRDFVPDWRAPEADLTCMTPEEQKMYLMNMFMKRSIG